jgi:uncharacterized protein (DUF433 family)
VTLPDFLAQDPYGYIHLAGHRIGLRHVVEFYQEGFTPAQLHDHFPILPLALIRKVVAFYLENQAEVDASIARSCAAIEQLANTPGQDPDAAELRRRMEAQRRPESA